MKPLRYNLSMQGDIHRILEEKCQLNRRHPIIIGVSGGADSLTLVNILVRLGYKVVAAHFNHLLRPEANDEARTVEGIAGTLKIPFTLGVGPAADYALEHQLSIEEAARDLRYRFLFEQAEKRGMQAVAVAHNADDQVETVLMHLLRGAGLDGLTGMVYRSLPNPWSGTIPLVRPMLKVWRSEIEAYCSANNLKPINDVTNDDPAFFRNRLRHELIPDFETYIPGFRTRLWQTSDLLTADRDVIAHLTESTWTEIVKQSGAGFVSFYSPVFCLQPLGLKRRLMRKAIAHLRSGARDVDFAMIQRALDFAAKPTLTKQADLGLGLRIMLDGENLVISEWGSRLPTHYPQITDQCSLPVPGKLDLGNGWILKAEILEDLETAQKYAKENHDPFQAWIDLEEQQPFLKVRPRLSGDRFKPLGMGGKSMKISDFMINQKIPQRARADWPLVCIGDEIVWVPGHRLGHNFRMQASKHLVVKLSLILG